MNGESSQRGLECIISNEELGRRVPRPADAQAEQVALQSLAQELAGSPRRVLQSLSDVALQLCRAHSAGISLLEEEGGRRIFRWHAVSGRFAPYLWSTLPREFSPCGTVLDRGAAQLMSLPERYFTALEHIQPKISEVLLIPFSVGEAIVGTVWIIAHDETRRFDSQDRRVITKLAKFAAVAYAGLSSLSSADVLRVARLSKTKPLLRAVEPRNIQRRVLVVDDNVDAAVALAELLRTMGHIVHVAHTGRDAIEICERVRLHLVLVDIALPDTTGHEVARHARQQQGPDVRIVTLTGFGSDDDRRQSEAAGCDQHLIKPLDPAFLKSLIG